MARSLLFDACYALHKHPLNGITSDVVCDLSRPCPLPGPRTMEHVRIFSAICFYLVQCSLFAHGVIGNSWNEVSLCSQFFLFLIPSFFFSSVYFCQSEDDFIAFWILVPECLAVHGNKHTANWRRNEKTRKRNINTIRRFYLYTMFCCSHCMPHSNESNELFRVASEPVWHASQTKRSGFKFKCFYSQ